MNNENIIKLKKNSKNRFRYGMYTLKTLINKKTDNLKQINHNKPCCSIGNLANNFKESLSLLSIL